MMLLITGITGLTGRFLIRALCEAGYSGNIRCLIRKHSDISWITDNNIEFVKGDVTDVESLIKACQGVSGVIHLVNIRSSPEIIEACKANGINRLIIVTTTGIFSKYQQYSNEYKRLENIIRNCGLDYTIIRPTMIYGNHQDKNIHKLVKIVNRYKIIPVVGKGYGLMQPIYAKDLATVIAQAYVNDISIGRAYNVAGKTAIRFCDIMAIIAKNLEVNRIFINIPYQMALLGGYFGQIIGSSLINVERIQRLQEDKVFDYQEASKDLGFSPISFEEGIKLEIASLKEAGII
ncbi:MAG: NAD-dependent epimerase/dehydratase family protein [Syntrophomonadaceae bacterium]